LEKPGLNDAVITYKEDLMETKTIPSSLVHMDQKISDQIVSTARSTLLLFFLMFPLTFVQLILHEGGHALFNLAERVPIDFLYVHPFSFVGFVRPMVNYDSIWQHVLGIGVELLVSSMVFIACWKHRSFYTIPLLMVFPWIAIFDGIGGVFDILGKSGDVYNLTVITGLPASIFLVWDTLLALVGIFLFISILPRLGLDPKEKKSLFVLPVGMLMHSALGLVVAVLFVPGSSIEIRYHLAREILVSAYYRPLFMGSIGLLLALIYLTLYHGWYKKLPSGLRLEKASLTWRGLRYPTALFAISLILGLLIVA
jgi:hypothetical protein